MRSTDVRKALQEAPESFTETYEEVLSRPQSFWENFLQHHEGLVHIAFCVPRSDIPDKTWDNELDKVAWMIQHGTAQAMAVNTGHIPPTRFLGWPDSPLSPTRPATEEFNVHADMLFLSPAIRGQAGSRVKMLLELDRDMWLLDQLRAVKAASPPRARLRGHVKPGRYQEMLLRFYVRAGWYVAGRQTFGANLLAKSGREGVEVARGKGYRIDEVGVVVEKIFTVAHLEWQIEENKKLLGKASGIEKSLL